MDSLDAVLEHLKQLRRQGINTLAERLEQVIADLDRALENAKSSLADALPGDPDRLFPLDEVEGELQRLDATRPAAPGVSLDELRTLDGARTQSELLRALLPVLEAHAGRVAVLVIREGVITAWSGTGFADESSLRSWQGAVSASPGFSSLVEDNAPLHFAPADDPLLAEWLADDGLPEEALLLPISLRGKLMGIVYLDHRPDEPWNPEAAQAANAVACLLIDTLKYRTTAPSPTLAAIVEQVTAAEPEAEAEPEVFAEEPGEPDFEPAAEVEVESSGELDTGYAGFEGEPEYAEEEVESFSPPASEGLGFETPAAPPPPEAEIEVDYDFEPEAEPEADQGGFDPSATVRVEVDREQLPPSVPPSVEELGAPPPVQPVVPPPPPAPRAADSAEDDARHEEARRFARLLVSEIKLYNEDEVERGRIEHDLLQRLKEDIDRSREMYEKRIPPEIRSQRDYFRDELVRILADGDAGALGG